MSGCYAHIQFRPTKTEAAVAKVVRALLAKTGRPTSVLARVVRPTRGIIDKKHLSHLPNVNLSPGSVRFRIRLQFGPLTAPEIGSL